MSRVEENAVSEVGTRSVSGVEERSEVLVAEFVCCDESDMLIGVLETKFELPANELEMNAKVELPLNAVLKVLVLEDS